jgi:hypothetical protein
MLDIDPQAAVSISEEIPLKELLGKDGFFKAWSEKNAPGAGRALAERMQKEGVAKKIPLDGNSAGEVFAIWTGKDPKGVAVFAMEQGSALRDTLFPSAVHNMSSRDREATLEWVQGLPIGEARRMAYEAVASQWVGSSINEVAEWLPSVPLGDDYAAAVGGFAGRAFVTDPASALEWVRTIPDANARERALKTAWKEWSEFRNDEQAHAWLKSTEDLTAAERAVLERKDAE